LKVDRILSPCFLKTHYNYAKQIIDSAKKTFQTGWRSLGIGQFSSLPKWRSNYYRWWRMAKRRRTIQFIRINPRRHVGYVRSYD